MWLSLISEVLILLFMLEGHNPLILTEWNYQLLSFYIIHIYIYTLY